MPWHLSIWRLIEIELALRYLWFVGLILTENERHRRAILRAYRARFPTWSSQ